MVLYSQCFDLLYETFYPCAQTRLLARPFFEFAHRGDAAHMMQSPVLSLQLMRGREKIQHAANQPLPMWDGSDIEV